MEASATMRGSSALVFKQVLGETRRERWNFVENVFKTQIQPIYHSNANVLERSLNGMYRVRALYSDSHPVGLMIYDKRLQRSFHGLQDCLEIKVLHSIVEEKKEHRIEQVSYMLDCIKKDAIEMSARSIAIEVPKNRVEEIKFLESRKFTFLEEGRGEPPMVLLSLTVDETKNTNSRGQKRAREESKEVKSQEPPLKKRVPVPIPVPGREAQLPPQRVVPPPFSQAQRGSGSPKICSTTIKGVYFDFIRRGQKTVEVRINKGMFKNAQQGGIMQFICNGRSPIQRRILNKTVYTSFEHMLEHVPYKQCVPDAISKAHALKIYTDIPGYKESAAQFGVVAFTLGST